MRFVAATHNIMDGLFLKKLLRHYADVGSTVSHDFGILCLQENVTIIDKNDSKLEQEQTLSVAKSHDLAPPTMFTSCAELIANTLGKQYHVAAAASDDSRLATVYNSKLFDLVGKPTIFKLPRLSSLPVWNKLFIKSGAVEQKHALVCDFRLRDDHYDNGGGQIIRSINFHLDAAGNNQHRIEQMSSLLHAMRMAPARDLTDSKDAICYAHVVSGDTNIFHLDNDTQRMHLQCAVDCLHPFIPTDHKSDLFARPTHFFSRANEPFPAHQLGVFLGKYFGKDRPQCYDVVLTNMKTVERGQIITANCSDHDLVYAVLQTEERHDVSLKTKRGKQT